MRIVTLLITTIGFFNIYSGSANSSFPIPTLSKESSYSWLIAENHNSLSDNESKVTLFQQLNLTSNQQRQIEKIHRLYYPKIIKLREQLTILKEELTSMMAGTESAPNIRTKHQEILNLGRELGKLQLETMLATREVLTPEQRQDFADILRSRR